MCNDVYLGEVVLWKCVSIKGRHRALELETPTWALASSSTIHYMHGCEAQVHIHAWSHCARRPSPLRRCVTSDPPRAVSALSSQYGHPLHAPRRRARRCETTTAAACARTIIPAALSIAWRAPTTRSVLSRETQLIWTTLTASRSTIATSCFRLLLTSIPISLPEFRNECRHSFLQ